MAFCSTASAVIIPDFQVNPPDTAFIAQYDNDIAFQPNGNFVVVWVDRGIDHDNRQVYFQHYDSSANPIDGPILVSDTSTGFYNQMCKIATDSVGNFVICYSSIKYSNMTTAEDIWVRLYDINGLSLTSSIKVDVDRPDQAQGEVEVYIEWGPDIDRHKSGKFVVAWAEEIGYSDTIPVPQRKRIYTQFFDANGQRIGNNIWVTEPDTGEYMVNNTFAWTGITDNGYALVSWDGLVPSPRGSYGLPMGRIFSLDGVSVTKVFPEISPDDPDWIAGGFADVDATPNNDFALACEAYDSLRIYPQGTMVTLRLDTLGNPINRPQAVPDTILTDEWAWFVMPRVAAGQAGYIVLWADARWKGDLERDLMAQRFDYNDQPIGKNYRINGAPQSLFWNWRFYGLDISPQGKVAISWADSRNYDTTYFDIFCKVLENNEIGFYLSGDLNQDGKVSLVDLIFLVNYIFKGGAQPIPLYIGDVNADCKISLTDIIYLVNYIFKSGPAPQQGCA